MWVKGKVNVGCVEDFAFTLLPGAAVQGCQGFGRRGQGSRRRGQSGTSGKWKEREKDVMRVGKQA